MENVKSQSAIKLKTLINGFNVNDIYGQDELSVSVYSDVTKDMFKCGDYAFKSGDIVDFEGLVVPCNEMITVTLTEVDFAFNEGHTVLIPCRSQSEMTIDLKLPKGEVS